MNRRLGLAGGAVGAFAFWQWFRRKPRAVAPVADPADELRAKLAATRVEEPLAPAADAVPAAEAPADPEARRRSVHEQARARLDQLKDSGEASD